MNDFYTYAAEMKKYLEAQAKKVQSLEDEINRIKAEQKRATSQAPIHIDKIEYKFDQLKIEKLDGTLNIGINPSDLHEIEEMAANGKPFPVPYPPQYREELSDQIASHIADFIEKELPSLISTTELEIGRSFHGEYDQFIQQDLLKQLDSRISYYLKQFPPNEQNRKNPEYAAKIIEQMKSDIEQAVRAFLLNIHEGTKGMK
ncbi:spore germination protein GerPC [Bacillus sp. 1P06AnD]|uniref:spore germination protein GerPC n=1 Tax=Bacillus sp. 1P06AnD TaxID=3132208 RepID=UPI0039A2092E